MSVLNKVVDLSAHTPTLNACLYGPSGAGKTALAGGAPTPLLVDCENGWKSLRNHEWSRDVKVFPLTQFDELTEIIWAFREGKPEIEGIETIIVDTYTELQAKTLSYLLTTKHAKDESRNPYASQMIDYKEATEMLRRAVVALCDLPVNVVFVCHDVEVKDESSGRILTRPALTPKLAQTVKGLVDVQGHLTASITREGEVERFLQLQPSNNVDAKCRIGGLDPIIKNPTFEMLIKANANQGEN